MAQSQPIKPARYSPTDTQETESIDTFKSLIDHSKVKPDIKERNTIPNIDGYVELVDDGGSPCGKLEVQIKKLPNNSTKLQIPTSLYAYSEKATCNPVILIGVDIKQKQAFWFHINSKTLNAPIEKINQASITINFSYANIIDGTSTVYLNQWQAIVDSYLDLKNVNEKYELLRDRSNPIIGVEKKEYIEIQKFLDELNGLLDGRFSTVKKTFYPNSWKIGFAYHSYKEDSVEFSLYSVPYGMNDVLIKEIDEKLENKMKEIGFTTHGFFKENPVRVRPKKLAVDQIQEGMKEILSARLLNHNSSEFLVREFTFAFIDKFHIQMGLTKKDVFSLLEIEKGFLEYLPVWTLEAIKFMIEQKRNGVTSFRHALFGRSFFDPSLILSSIMPEERKLIAERTKTAIAQKIQLPILPLGNRDISFKLFYESLGSLRLRGTTEVTRPYIQKDFSRLDHLANWKWNILSPEALEKNLAIFFENLPDAYNQIVSNNFEDIKGELPLFGGVNLEIVLFDVKSEVKVLTDAPKISFYGLCSAEKEDFSITLSDRKKAGTLSSISMQNVGNEITIDGHSYKMVTASEGVLDFIFEDTPLLDFIYDRIKQNLDEYFNKLRLSESRK